MKFHQVTCLIRESYSPTIKTINFVLDDSDRVIEERDSDGNTISRIIWSEELPSSYIYKDKVYQYVCNSRGDVVALLDEVGTEVNTYKYDIWGQLIESNETIPNAIRYNHEYYDEESGFYYLRGRYYDPSVRRFTTPDPAEDGINWYAYCGNNPVDYIDPSGYAKTVVTKKMGEDYFWTKYYSGNDLLELFNTSSTPETIAKIIVGAVASFLPKKISIPAFIVSTATEVADARLSDLAQQAFKTGKGISIEYFCSPDYDPSLQGIKIIDAKIVEDLEKKNGRK